MVTQQTERGKEKDRQCARAETNKASRESGCQVLVPVCGRSGTDRRWDFLPNLGTARRITAANAPRLVRACLNGLDVTLSHAILRSVFRGKTLSMTIFLLTICQLSNARFFLVFSPSDRLLRPPLDSMNYCPPVVRRRVPHLLKRMSLVETVTRDVLGCGSL
jgi:hypothetical protein